MISTVSQTVQSNGLDQSELFDVLTRCTHQTCSVKIRAIEKRLSRIPYGSELLDACQSRLRHAKRFLKSDEYGGCDYELKIIELLMSEA